MARRWRRALITGASAGIGRAFAERLAAEGTDVVLVARSVDRLGELAADLHRAHGVVVEVLPADLADPVQLGAVARRLGGDPGIDLLVNNAGLGYHGAFAALPLERAMEQVNVNLVALVQLSHAALGAMRAAGKGTLLNVSSVAGEVPGVGSAIYGATKAFVTQFSSAIAAEAAADGVGVTVVLPGATRTEFQERAGVDLRLPAVAWQSADAVAAAALDGAAKGRVMVIPGAHNKGFVAATKVTPRGLTRRISAARFRR